MSEFSIKSKVYITPKKKFFIPVVILNMCIVIVAIISLLSIITSGIKIGNISAIIISLFIVIRTKKWNKIEPYYQFSVANVKLSNDSIIISYDIGQTIVLNVRSIKSIEYSDQLKCMRFIGDYIFKETNKILEHYESEYLLYVDENEYPEFFHSINQITNQKIIYMDRKNDE